MPNKINSDIPQLIEDLIMQPVEKHDYDMADRIYLEFKQRDLSKEEQIAVFEEIFKHLKSLWLPQKAALGARAFAKFGTKPPQYMKDIKKVLESGKAKAGQPKTSRRQRAEAILDIILEASPIAKQDAANTDSARSSPVTDTESDISIDERPEPTAEELAKFNKKAIQAYTKVIVNLEVYTDFLIKKFSADINDTEFYQTQLKNIKENLNYGINQIDSQQAYTHDALPIGIQNLVMYASRLIELEAIVDASLMQQVAKYHVPMQSGKETGNKPHAFAVVDALSKLFDILVNIKNHFAAFFSRRPSINEQRAKATQVADRKNLMLFYDAIKPGMVDSLAQIKQEVSKLQTLPTPKN